MALTVKPLNPDTWPGFAALVERHRGVWGGCWCLEFHPEGAARGDHRRAAKEARVRAGTAHAALVFDGPLCVGWCQFGSPSELPRIKHRRAYEAGLDRLPDWRITCFFVDSTRRREGVASQALAGALDLIASQGGGLVEGYPEDVTGRTISSSFLHGSTLSTFEAQGFEKIRPLGKNHWLLRKTVVPRV